MYVDTVTLLTTDTQLIFLKSLEKLKACDVPPLAASTLDAKKKLRRARARMENDDSRPRCYFAAIFKAQRTPLYFHCAMHLTNDRRRAVFTTCQFRVRWVEATTIDLPLVNLPDSGVNPPIGGFNPPTFLQ